MNGLFVLGYHVTCPHCGKRYYMGPESLGDQVKIKLEDVVPEVPESERPRVTLKQYLVYQVNSFFDWLNNLGRKKDGTDSSGHAAH